LSYIDSNLLPDERIVFRTRLHWLLFLWPVVFVVFVMFPAAWLLVSSSWSSYAWMPLAASLLVPLPAFIKRMSSDFAVTNKRIMMKEGVFHTRSTEVLLSKVESIAVDQSLAGRILDYGNIVVSGTGGTKETFLQIQAPLEFRRAVQSVADKEVKG
jgi:uncharacterized membrane protein YdbT with pleckstrin-like domain